jgi:diguanylate cyclase (GGDEF)-like protein
MGARAGSARDVPVRSLLVTGASDAHALRERLAADPALAGGPPLRLDLVPTVADAIDRASRRPHDAILLELPSSGEDRLAPLVALAEQAPDVAVIVLVDDEHDPAALEAIHAGAQDALARATVTGALVRRSARHAAVRHRVQLSLHALALVDELTELYNRRGFLTLARQQMKAAERARRALVHIYADLDGLKIINDTFGHREGDLALIETADLLRAVFRETDVVARIGGDEFAVLAIDTGERSAELLLERLAGALAARNAHRHRPWLLSLSVGATVYDPDDPCVVEELIARADARMYAQKRSRAITPLDVAAIPHAS